MRQRRVGGSVRGYDTPKKEGTPAPRSEWGKLVGVNEAEWIGLYRYIDDSGNDIVRLAVVLRGKVEGEMRMMEFPASASLEDMRESPEGRARAAVLIPKIKSLQISDVKLQKLPIPRKKKTAQED